MVEHSSVPSKYVRTTFALAVVRPDSSATPEFLGVFLPPDEHSASPN